MDGGNPYDVVERVKIQLPMPIRQVPFSPSFAKFGTPCFAFPWRGGDRDCDCRKVHQQLPYGTLIRYGSRAITVTVISSTCAARHWEISSAHNGIIGGSYE
jgi:hypothetical protein